MAPDPEQIRVLQENRSILLTAFPASISQSRQIMCPNAKCRKHRGDLFPVSAGLFSGQYLPFSV
jgi:hypothetical protein